MFEAKKFLQHYALIWQCSFTCNAPFFYISISPEKFQMFIKNWSKDLEHTGKSIAGQKSISHLFASPSSIWMLLTRCRAKLGVMLQMPLNRVKRLIEFKLPCDNQRDRGTEWGKSWHMASWKTILTEKHTRRKWMVNTRQTSN